MGLGSPTLPGDWSTGTVSRLSPWLSLGVFEVRGLFYAHNCPSQSRETEGSPPSVGRYDRYKIRIRYLFL